MRNQGLSLSCLVAAILSVCFCVDFVFAAQPSFDCSKASSPDQVAICSNETLAIADNVANSGFEYLRSKLGRSAANKIDLPLIKKRQSCGGDYQCILNAQIEAINTFIKYGAPITIPNFNGDRHQPNNIVREELGASHEAAPETAQEAERRRQAEVEATRQSDLKVEARRQEEIEAERHSAEQAERQRQAEADSVQHALKEGGETLGNERLHQGDIQIALMVASGLLVLGGAFLLAKTIVKRKRRAVGPSLVGKPLDHETHYEASKSTQSTARSAEPIQSSVNSRLDTLELEQAAPSSEGQAETAIWYYEKEGKSFGPVTEELIKILLKNNELNKDTFVWKRSFGSQWVSIQNTELIS